MFYIVLNTNNPQFCRASIIEYKKTFYFQVMKKLRMHLGGEWYSSNRKIEVKQPKSSKLRNNKHLWII